MPTTNKTAAAHATGPEADEALHDAAQGVAPTSDEPADDGDEGTTEIDAIGEAAGIPSREGKPLGGPDKIARRDAHRWELDPASAEDADTREPSSRRSRS
jgi:uncharacterized protein DUF6335